MLAEPHWKPTGDCLREVKWTSPGLGWCRMDDYSENIFRGLKITNNICVSPPEVWLSFLSTGVKMQYLILGAK